MMDLKYKKKSESMEMVGPEWEMEVAEEKRSSTEMSSSSQKKKLSSLIWMMFQRRRWWLRGRVGKK